MDTEPAKRSLRYAVATMCFILVAMAGGWLLWRIYDDLGFAVLVLSGNVRTHKVVLQCLALPFIALWLVGVLRVEAWFRWSVSAGSASGPDGGKRPEDLAKKRPPGLLERSELDVLFRQVLIAAAILLGLWLLDLLVRQLPYLS